MKIYFVPLFFIILVISMKSCKQSDIPKSLEAKVVPGEKAELGEGAIWDYQQGLLFWIDIEGRKFFSYNPVTQKTMIFQLEKRIGTLVPDENGNVIIALEDGLYQYSIQDKVSMLIERPESLSDLDRFNDGKCDAKGRYWVGSMKMDGVMGGSFLYKYSPDSGFSEMIDSVQISNGIIWSNDNTKMYYIDTPSQKVVVYDFDLSSGEISNPKTLVEIPDSMGHPDGMTIDEKGNLWVALWGGYSVVCYNAETGELIHKINVPVKNVTSCAFGGKNLDTLFITTSKVGNGLDELKEQQHAGGLFAVVPGVRGVKANYYKK